MNTLERIVVLIDADNTRFRKLELILQEISTRGRIVVKRAYGNWKKDNLKNWEEELKRLAIKPEQQFDYVTGKNATDMALVIDAIELLHSSIYDGFVLVSSDSDYTPLSIKLHESGVYVIGVGEHKTPVSFRNSCDEFVFLENLNSAESSQEEEDAALPPADAAVAVAEAPHSNEESTSKPDSLQVVHALLRKAWETYQDEDEFVNVSSAGTYIKRVKPDFDVRSFGYSKLPKLIEGCPDMYDIKKFRGKGTVTIFAYKCK
ncbi:MAG: NYN domain-containing protein [Oscillospiraceae bacterium]|nr:NYN domain-containing protein [Oscillospiraceae bacterium]